MADWLTARPIAHRGLHGAAKGIIENTASAIIAAIEAGYGIEVDLQVTADGEAVVHHDDKLGRLTEGSGRLNQLTSRELQDVRFKATADRILTLPQLCELVEGRVPLLLDLKSQSDRDERLPRRVAAVVSIYSGPVAAMSFDAGQLEMLHAFAPKLRRGLVAQRRFASAASHWAAFRAGPDFLAYAVRDLPATLPLVAKLTGTPVLAWTVRSDEDRQRAQRWADQIIFEGFRA